jgi:hypothetical protein
MKVLRALPIVLLLAACELGGTSYSDTDEAKETCRDLGHQGAAYNRCVAEREHQAACRRFINSRDYSAAEARRRKCD